MCVIFKLAVLPPIDAGGLCRRGGLAASMVVSVPLNLNRANEERAVFGIWQLALTQPEQLLRPYLDDLYGVLHDARS